MKKLKIDEPVTLPCGETITLVNKSHTSLINQIAVIASDAFIIENNEGVTKGQNLIAISKKSIKPLIEFLQRLDLTLEG